MFKHTHRWELISAKGGEQTGGMVGAMTGSVPLTFVLWRCAKCGDLRSEVLTGPFSLDINELVKSNEG